MTGPALAPADDTTRERALEVLLGPGLASIVDFAAWSPADGEYHVASAQGHMRFFRRADGSTNGTRRWDFDAETLSGRDPIGHQDPSRFGDLESERSVPHPDRNLNAYPHAYDHLAQVFDHPSAPDIIVLHTAAHYWGDQGGHLGEHGSLGVVQARAPFIASGAGIEGKGMVDRSCRLIDVAPTVLGLLGCSPRAGGNGTMVAHQDGDVLDDLVGQPGGADHVVAMLLDGTNANVLYDLAARGAAPNVALLMAAGCTYRYGAIASLPTVTLANHTSILTGRHPGHHRILHNAWVDRTSGQQVVTNSPSTWVTSMQWLDPGTETIHQALHAARPGSLSVSVNEPCDPGADYSVFELMRTGASVDRPPPIDDVPDTTQRFVRPSKDYRWSSLIDHTAVEQFAGIWRGWYRDRSWPTPDFTWVNFTLTDAAFHEGGPYSEIAESSVRDTDARIGHLLEAVERSGARDRTAFLLMADHGMELADPAVTGDWDLALAEAGVAFRDEGYGFLYLTDA